MLHYLKLVDRGEFPATAFVNLEKLNPMDASFLSPQQDPPTSVTPLQLFLLGVWSVGVVCLGGYGSGVAILKFGTLGVASLWLVGEVAGLVGRKLVPQKNTLAGSILVVACCLAFVVAEVCWIHWRIIPARESWIEAIRYLPVFAQKFTLAAVLGAVFCFFGASSAFRRVARRYRVVHVVEE